MLIPFLTFPVMPSILYPTAGSNSTLLLTATLVVPLLLSPMYKLAIVLALSVVSLILSITQPDTPCCFV